MVIPKRLVRISHLYGSRTQQPTRRATSGEAARERHLHRDGQGARSGAGGHPVTAREDNVATATAALDPTPVPVRARSRARHQG